MKKRYILFGCILCPILFFPPVSHSQWIQTTDSILVNCGVLSVAANASKTFIATDSGIYYSSNNGLDWERRNNGLNDTTTEALLINDPYIYAGTLGAGVYR